MRQKTFLSFLFLLLFTFPFQFVLSQSNIIIDEDFRDWNASHPTYTDGRDTPNGIDLLQMQASNDEKYLYVKFSVDRELALGNTLVDHTIWLSIDADNDPATGHPEQAGYGTELAINFNGHFAWFNAPDPDVRVFFGDIGLQLAPTVTSSTFEMAIPRNLKPDGINELFTGDTIRLVVNEDQGGDRMPNAGSIFSYVFDNSASAPVTSIELTKEEPEHIRAIAYNVLRDNAWSNAGLPSLERIVKTLEGDIFCFQESGSTSPQDAKRYLDIWLPLDNGGAGWYVYKDAGRLTCSKWPITDTWDLWRKTAMLVDLPSSYPKDLLVINGHLSCCTANADRQGQVDEFASFLLDAKAPGGAITLPDSTPVIFLGDMNFVGFRQQVETVITGNIRNAGTYGPGAPLDWDNTDLADARPLHIDSNLVFTWRDLGGDGFPPGRLDYQFYTDAVFDNVKSFVLQTETMDPQELARYDLQRGDTEVSDHLPLVVDYAFKQSQVTTSLDEVAPGVGIRVYPNPASDYLMIETEEEIMGIRIRDLRGKEVLSTSGNSSRVDIAKLTPGTYLVEVKLRGNKNRFTYRVAVDK